MKFSITQMLYGMVVFAFIAAIIGAGANGSPLAYGIGISILMVVVYFFFFAVLYWGTLLATGRWMSVSSSKAASDPVEDVE